MATPQLGALPGTPSTQAFGDAAAKGVGPGDALEDHKHAMPTAPVPVPGPITGKAYWFSPQGLQDAGTAGAIAALGTNLMVAVPIWLKAGAVVDRLAILCGGSVASAAVRIGLYADGGGIPSGAALVDSGSIVAATTGLKTATVSYTVPTSGWYWLALVAQTANPNVQQTATLGSGPLGTATTPASNINASVVYVMKHTGTVSGALPTWSQAATQDWTLVGPFATLFYRIT